MSEHRDSVIGDVRRALGRDADSPLARRPSIVAPRIAEERDAEMNRLIEEINALAGVAERIDAYEIGSALKKLAEEYEIRRASIWSTPRLNALRIEDRLRRHGVEIIPPNADKHELA
jgi:hypothetical protein